MKPSSVFRAKNLSVNTWRSGPDICSLICEVDPYFRFPFFLSIFLARFFVVCKSFYNINFLCFTKDPGKPQSNIEVCFRNCIYIHIPSIFIDLGSHRFLSLVDSILLQFNLPKFLQTKSFRTIGPSIVCRKGWMYFVDKICRYIRLCHISNFQSKHFH